MRVSLDKVESSNPNLTAAHAGASTGETGTCNQMLRMLQMPKEGCFAVSRLGLAFHIRVLSKSGGKGPLRKTISLLNSFMVPTRKVFRGGGRSRNTRNVQSGSLSPVPKISDFGRIEQIRSSFSDATSGTRPDQDHKFCPKMQ
jgi:hypothetical protein